MAGPHSWAALDRLAVAPSPVPVPPIPVPPVPPPEPPRPEPPRPQPPRPQPPTPLGAIEAGREVVATVPLLQAHRGSAPDLVLRWNAMAAPPEAIDVAVHLHGFSSRAAAMRLDVDKEPDSGLDFADPDAPALPGRQEPTLCVLPRGNFYGGRTGMGYDFPALVTADGLERLVAFALARFASRAGLGDSAAPRLRRLLLTAHSGGGAALMRILERHDPDEVEVFDALYSDATPLIRWMSLRLGRPDAAAASMRVVYIPGTGTARQSEAVRQALRGLVADTDARARRFRVEPTGVDGAIPRRFGWLLLRDAGADLPLAGRPVTPPTPPTPPSPPQPSPPQPSPPTPAPSAPADAPAQADVGRLAAIGFGNAAEIEAFFARAGAASFADWFNATLGGRTPFVRLGGGGPMRMPTAADARARFAGFGTASRSPMTCRASPRWNSPR